MEGIVKKGSGRGKIQSKYDTDAARRWPTVQGAVK